MVILLDQLARGGGGAEVFSVGLATQMAARGIDVRVCTTRQAEGFLVDRLDEAGVPHMNLDRTGRYDLGPFRRLARYLRQEHIDVVHAHLFGSNLWGSVLGSLVGVPVVVAHEHTWSYEGQRLRKLVDGFVIGRLADAFVAVSSVDRARMVSLERVPARKTVVIPAAYVPGEHGGPLPDLRGELGIGPDAPLVGVVAVLRPQKALDVMLEAVALLRERLPEVRLVVIGEGPQRAEWEDHAARLGLAEAVTFTGMRPDASTLIPSFDVSALSSDFEGTPLFVMESMARGTPLVCTDVGGLRDIVEQGESALLVPPRDPARLAEALEAVLTDDALAHTLVANGRRAVTGLTIEQVSLRVERLYARLLAGEAPEPASMVDSAL